MSTTGSTCRASVGDVLTGAALGLSGSLLQQITQNRLVSPMTIGASSGAWLGLVLDTPANAANAAVISNSSSRITAFVIATDEEQVIADEALSILDIRT